MTGQPRGERPKRVPELRLPYPLLEDLLKMKGPHAKLGLRLMQLAGWKAKVTPDGIELDAGELLLALRSRAFWAPIEPDTKLTEAGRVSLLRRALERLERDGIISVRPARRTGTASGTSSNTPTDTPPTIVRFLKYRDILWPANGDATQGPTRQPTREPTHDTDTIPANNPTHQAGEGEGGSSDATATATLPRLPQPPDAIRALLDLLATAFHDIKGVAYQHASRGAVVADRRAAAELLAVPGIQAETIEQVWRWALPQTDWPRIDTIPDLARLWVSVAPRALIACRESAAANPSARAAPLTCPVWAEMARRLQRDLRPDLFERWFAPLQVDVFDRELVLSAPDRFHRDFVHDNYLGLLGELQEKTRSETEAFRGIDRLRIVAEGETEASSTKFHPNRSVHQETSSHAQH
jgi:hypothetical protein